MHVRVSCLTDEPMREFFVSKLEKELRWPWVFLLARSLISEHMHDVIESRCAGRFVAFLRLQPQRHYGTERR